MDQKVNIGQRSTTKVEFLKSSIFIQFSWNVKRIYISVHWIQPPIIFEVHIGQKVNIGQISKIVNFHPIHLKFEEELYIWSLNWTTNYFWGQICFVDFASIVLCMTYSSCSVHLSVFLSLAGHNFKPIFRKPPHGRDIHKEEAYCFWGQKVNIGQRSTTNMEFLKSSIYIRFTWIWRGVAYLVIEFNHQLFLRSNLFDVFCKYVLYTTSSSCYSDFGWLAVAEPGAEPDLGWLACYSILCYSEESFWFRQLCWSVVCVILCVCLSVCLCVCLPCSSHTVSAIMTKLGPDGGQGPT